MPRKKSEEEKRPPDLVVARDFAERHLRHQLEKAYALAKPPPEKAEELDSTKYEFLQWVKLTKEMLVRFFSNDGYAREFNEASPSIGPLRPYDAPELSFGQRRAHLGKRLQHKIGALESILERLPHLPETANAEILPVRPSQHSSASRKVFVVHGHDDAAKLNVEKVLRKLELEPIILHDMPNKGRTVIEKFEDYSDVGFAVIIFTPDDVGGPKDKNERKPRARQNVIFELGFFVGRLGRDRAFVLYKGDVEILSDYQGVIYVLMDEAGAWQLELANEMNCAGLDMDLNKLKKKKS